MLFHKFFQCPKLSQKSWQSKQHAWSADKAKLLQSSSKQAGFEKHCVLWIKCYPQKPPRINAPGSIIHSGSAAAGGENLPEVLLPLILGEKMGNGAELSGEAEVPICIAPLSTPKWIHRCKRSRGGWAPKFVFSWLRAWALSGKHREREWKKPQSVMSRSVGSPWPLPTVIILM